MESSIVMDEVVTSGAEGTPEPRVGVGIACGGMMVVYNYGH